MDHSTELDLLTGPATEAPRIKAEPSLVFVAFRLSWKQRISDLAMNTRFAEEWEGRFTHWEIDDRLVHLCDFGRGYTVDLTDGRADFIIFRPNEMLDSAATQITQYCQALVEGGRVDTGVYCEAKYLTSLEHDFADEVLAMEERLIKRDVLASLSPDVSDFAYNVDFAHEGQWFQVQAGVLRKEEVPGRVESARFFKRIPSVSRFVSVKSRAGIDREFTYGDFLNRVFHVGETIARELSA
jgi:hypothetical protein